ncbi:MAG: hypothetical protein QOE77_980 [Blastocatellia bacterium]|jgi:hypothetical protein|nr:hypothetical protein [Blastocatellia bacterium]
MFFFGRWNVFEEPARGRATLTLAVAPDGRVYGVPGEDGWTFDHTLTFLITAHPWHRTGKRPFACDSFIGPSKKDGVGSRGNNSERHELVTIALAHDAKIDCGDYDEKVAPFIKRGRPHVKLRLIRVMDASILPELGEPIDAQFLIPAEQQSVVKAIAEDWARDNAITSEPTAFISSTGDVFGMDFPPEFYPEAYEEYLDRMGDSFYDVFCVIRSDNGIKFVCPREADASQSKSQSTNLKWSISLDWEPREPALAFWQWQSPYNNEKSQSRLRLITSPNVRISYETFHLGMLRDRAGNPLDPSDPEKSVDNDPIRFELLCVDALDRPPVDWFADSERFRLRPPDHRRFLELFDQISYEFVNFGQRDPFAVLALITLPLCIIASPALPVAVALGFGLSAGSLYCALAEREHVARYGYDSAYQPRTLNQVQSDLHWAVVGVVLSIAGPVIQGLRSTARLASALAGTTTDLSKIVAAVENAPAPLRLIVRQFKGPILGRLIALGARNPDSTLLAQLFAKTVHESIEPEHLFLLDHLRLSSIFTSNYNAFRLATLQKQYVKHLAYISSNFESIESGIDLASAQGRLALEPLEWILKSDKRSLRFAVMEQLVGADWKRVVMRHRQFIPLRQDVLKIYREFPQNLTYEAARKLRARLVPTDLKIISVNLKAFFHPQGGKLLVLRKRANKNAFSSMLQLEHPFERRFVNMLAGGKKEAAKLLDYEKEAQVILVPANRGVARRIPDFDGYIHSEKTDTLDWLIPVGSEHLYSLQNIRDAHAFTIASVGGRGPQTEAAVKLIDEAVASIAQKLAMTVEYGDPFAEGFASKFGRDAWNYVFPSKRVNQARFEKRYLLQNFLIDVADES